ncbi:MAG: YqcI/YcgG family protein [Pseudomonadota bacterium]|nr:YqcI/YcgG family protein [Pseudomonadota bacterium]
MSLLLDQHSALERREELLTAIADESFPCVGAKSAMACGTLRILVCRSLESAWDDVQIHSELLDWARAYREDSRGLRSLAVVFEGPCDLTEERFEQLMWKRLQSLADKDEWRGQSYDRRVSPDPDDPHFALSFGGAAFFVVGLHPGASRPGRRVPRPTLVFNLHDQFERLREEGRYESMREKIVRRDVALAGSVNPMLARYGEASGARQYSGRAVDDHWRCPFRDPRAPGPAK